MCTLIHSFRFRVQQLQLEVESQTEKISQLLVEKEKAVTDLIAIRKINRNIEKYVKCVYLGKCANYSA